MQVELRHQPVSAVARLHLAPGEGVRTRPGAMASMTLGVQVQFEESDGVSWHGFTAHPDAPGWVEVASEVPGDLHVIDLQAEEDSTIVLARRAWLAGAETVVVQRRWAGSQLLGGIGEELAQACGLGPLVLSCYGAFDRLVLRAGEGLSVDASHLVAYDSMTRVSVRTGLDHRPVLDLEGPGTVLTQTRRSR